MKSSNGADGIAELTRGDHGGLSQLLASLAAFLDKHRDCGALDGGAEDEWIWMTCTCGAAISRTLEAVRVGW